TVNACQYLRPDNAAQRFITWIGAAIVDVTGLYRRDDAIRIQSHSSVVKGPLVSMSAGQHVLGAGLCPLYRPSTRLARGQCTQSHVWIAGDFDPKSTAYIDAPHADLIDTYAERRRQELRRECRELLVREVLDALLFDIPLTDHNVVFQGRAREAAKMKSSDMDDVHRLLECLIHLPEFEKVIPHSVRPGLFVQQ